ncbi:hypothetical protein FM104_05465 [Microbacterium esteraromaticum]|uniref:Uncharacterized protein n=1 Tax=Microbacterium esteraromaticum TaxID=57043 RepID=A0A1R4J4E1_9MICO|nr:hypothetical protein [Microbacterium esteraromaticum]SJN26991.1 hypothetical protein FM104_05465 [Microbacterium esteraromaticum]
MFDAAEASRRRELQRRAFAPGGELSDAEAVELRALNERRRQADAAVVPPSDVVPPSGAGGADAARPDAGHSDAGHADGARSRAERAARARAGETRPMGGLSRASSDAPDARGDGTAVARTAADGGAAAGASRTVGTPAHTSDAHINATDLRAGQSTDGASMLPSASASGTASAPTSGPASASASAPRTRRRWLAPLAGVLILLLGIGVGWLAFGRDAAPAMTAAQRDTWVDLEASNDYDAGSVELVGSQDGADVWFATKHDAKSECAVVTVGEESGQSCLAGDELNGQQQLGAGLAAETDEGTFQFWGLISKTTTGQRVAVVQRYGADEGWGWRSQYDESELAIAEVLVAATGYAGEALQIIGYDAETPIWIYQGAESCVLVADDQKVLAEACGLDDDSTIDLAMPDAVYVVRLTNRGPVLTITRTPASVVCDVDSGYCATADDKTGLSE